MLRANEQSENPISHAIISASIEVHKQLGPGLLERAYEVCLAHELLARKIYFARQVPIPLTYEGKTLECGFKANMIVEDKVLVEVKAVSALTDIHKAKLGPPFSLSSLFC